MTRAASLSDLPALRELERAAGAPFRSIGVAAVADDDLPSHASWNAPHYARLGFQVVTDADMTDGLRRIREREAAHGLDRWPRVTMRRPVNRPGSSR